MSETWECTVCRASATIDLDRTPVRYDSRYPAETNSYSDNRPPPHGCPIQKGLLPIDLETDPNARRKL